MCRLKYLFYIWIPWITLLPIRVNALFAGGKMENGEIVFEYPGYNGDGAGSMNMIDTTNDALSYARLILYGIEGLAAIVLVGVLCYQSFRFATCSNAPNVRENAKNSILGCFLGAAILGGIHFLAGMALKLFGL